MSKLLIAACAVLSCVFLIMEGWETIRRRAEDISDRRRTNRPYHYSLCSLFLVCCVVIGAFGDHAMTAFHEVLGALTDTPG